jgi:hypothetical protein
MIKRTYLTLYNSRLIAVLTLSSTQVGNLRAWVAVRPVSPAQALLRLGNFGHERLRNRGYTGARERCTTRGTQPRFDPGSAVCSAGAVFGVEPGFSRPRLSPGWQPVVLSYFATRAQLPSATHFAPGLPGQAQPRFACSSLIKVPNHQFRQVPRFNRG